MSMGKPKDGDLQVVSVPEKSKPPLPPGAGSNALVEYTPVAFKEEEEDLEVKLRRINDNVPVRVNNTSGSSAGSGSGDFHQYRQMRRKEQDRLARMDVDYQKRKEVAGFNMRREERMKAAEERTAKKRSKRQKAKLRKKVKKMKLNAGEEEHQNEESSDDGDAENGEEDCLRNKLFCCSVI
ncbi:PRKR-interacting protein 1 [Quillaja saponaria]|uniref:PRKR-interacting protein 1 n=1 Tax=Quillaja saponaria TaxID=32244 RepID=A0AAD7M026_QUISA|nr:PRKR-interacting protein 1 [Quillaja saponaria]